MKRPAWLPGALVVAGVTLCAIYAFRETLTVGSDRLPGVDAAISYAWEVYTRAAFAMGRWPHWNPYFWSGTLHYADSLTAVIYPPAFVLRWLEPAAFLRWMAIAHLVISGTGALVLGRLIGLGWLAAAAPALALTIGGAAGASMNNGHMVVIYGVAWLPWALAFAIISVRRVSLLPHVALPFVIAMPFVGGYAQGAIYSTTAVAFYYLYSAFWLDPEGLHRSRWRPLAQLLTLGALTAGVTALQLLPFIELAIETARTQGLSYQRASAGAWEYRELATFFFPFGNGMSHRIAYVGWLLACAVPFAFFERGQRRTMIFLTLLTVGALALAFGDKLPLFRLHYQLFPGLRLPARGLYIVTLCVALAGGLGLEGLLRLTRERRWRPLGTGAIVSALLLTAATLAALRIAGSDTTAPVHLWPWLPMATAAALLVIVVFGARARRFVFVPALCVLAVDLIAFAEPAAHTVPIESAQTLHRWLGPPDGGRVLSLCENRISSTELLIAHRPAIDGPVGVTLKDYEDWRAMLRASERPTDIVGTAAVRRDLLDMSNVSTVVACAPIEGPGLRLISQVDSIFVYRNERAWPRATWTCGAQELPREEIARWLRQARYGDTPRLVPTNSVNIRWALAVDASGRDALEAKYGLVQGVLREGTTWRYRLDDISLDNVRALLEDPAIEDTHGLERASGELSLTKALADPSTPLELVIGTVPCETRGEVTTRVIDQPDGLVSADVSAPVDGLVFFSEPYYPERVAFVDGRKVVARKANLAFTAVPVPAGQHRVELRFVPQSFYMGMAVGAATLLIWAAAAWRSRRRRGV